MDVIDLALRLLVVAILLCLLGLALAIIHRRNDAPSVKDFPQEKRKKEKE